MKPFTPFQVGNYAILEVLAQGGMGCVYRAQQKGAGGFSRTVAIKQVLPEFVNDNTARQRFEFEAKICSQFNHPNIVQIIDFFQANGSYFLVMEYIRGITLQKIMSAAFKREIEIPIEFSLYVICEVLKGLEFAFQAKDESGKDLRIIHRDISPHNIMISREGGIKIVDFGLAQPDRGNDFSTAGVKGKFAYMSPEQADGRPMSTTTDIYSTAIVLHELITAKRLFMADTQLALWRLALEPKIDPPSALNPEVSERLSAITMRALSLIPQKRYPTADGFYSELYQCLIDRNPGFGAKDVAAFISPFVVQEPLTEEHKMNLPPALPQDPAATTQIDSMASQNNTLSPTFGGTYKAKQIEIHQEPKRGNFGALLMLALLVGIPYLFRDKLKIWIQKPGTQTAASQNLGTNSQQNIEHLENNSRPAENLDNEVVRIVKPPAIAVPTERRVAAEIAGRKVLLTLAQDSKPAAIRLEFTDSKGVGLVAEGCILTSQAPACPAIPIEGTPPFKVLLKANPIKANDSAIAFTRHSCEEAPLKGKIGLRPNFCEFTLQESLEVALKLE